MSDSARAARLRQISRRLRDTPCCGRGAPLVTDDDWQYLGLWPMPTIYSSSLGSILPNSGWYARCLYAYERLTGRAFPGQPTDKAQLPGLVADEVDRLAHLAGEADSG